MQVPDAPEVYCVLDWTSERLQGQGEVRNLRNGRVDKRNREERRRRKGKMK